VRVFVITAASLIAGASYYGMIEKRVQGVLDEARQDGILLFIDELHTIIATGPGGDGEHTRSISNMLKPALARGEIACIGATTDEEYRRFIEPDAALERRFQPIRVGELSEAQTLEILRSLRDEYAAEHNLLHNTASRKRRHSSSSPTYTFGDERYIGSIFCNCSSVRVTGFTLTV